MISVTTSYSGKSFIFKSLSILTETQSRRFQFPGFKSVFKKFPFRNGLVWMVGLTGETKLRHSNFSGTMWMEPQIHVQDQEVIGLVWNLPVLFACCLYLPKQILTVSIKLNEVSCP